MISQGMTGNALQSTRQLAPLMCAAFETQRLGRYLGDFAMHVLISWLEQCVGG
jgi:hypothetical protein